MRFFDRIIKRAGSTPEKPTRPFQKPIRRVYAYLVISAVIFDANQIYLKALLDLTDKDAAFSAMKRQAERDNTPFTFESKNWYGDHPNKYFNLFADWLEGKGVTYTEEEWKKNTFMQQEEEEFNGIPVLYFLFFYFDR